MELGVVVASLCHHISIGETIVKAYDPAIYHAVSFAREFRCWLWIRFAILLDYSIYGFVVGRRGAWHD